jgi:hypothetical protein
MAEAEEDKATDGEDAASATAAANAIAPLLTSWLHLKTRVLQGAKVARWLKEMAAAIAAPPNPDAVAAEGSPELAKGLPLPSPEIAAWISKVFAATADSGPAIADGAAVLCAVAGMAAIAIAPLSSDDEPAKRHELMAARVKLLRSVCLNTVIAFKNMLDVKAPPSPAPLKSELFN